MILELKEVKEMPEFSGLSDSVLMSKIEAAELMVSVPIRTIISRIGSFGSWQKAGDALKGRIPIFESRRYYPDYKVRCE